jgi:mRNA interferase YafQ
MDKRGYDLSKLEYVLDKLSNREKLDSKYLNHTLQGKYTGLSECHISNDWLLIYEASDVLNIVSVIRTGTHSDLF